ncbi:MAG: glycosyltransferase [Candidatus Eisenbacteria bacterium]
MNRSRVLYVFRHTLGAPLPRLHGLDQLRALSARGRRFSVISFEPRDRTPTEEIQYEAERRALADAGIEHVALPQLRSRWFEIPMGALAILRLVLLRRVRTVHARSHVPAIMAALARAVSPLRLVFDMRGLFVDEYVLEGALRPGSAKLAFARALERWLLSVSDVVVVVSERFREHLQSAPGYAGRVDPAKVRLIPNRAALDRFEDAVHARAATRESRGYEESVVGVFAGAASPWHRLDLTAELMRRVMDERPDVRFLVAVYPSTEGATRIARECGLPEERTEILTAPTDEIPYLFAASDFGLMLVDDDVSKQVCAPVKFAEYLASGLPVVAGGGMGDACDWIDDEGLGILVDPDDVAASSRRVLDFLRSDDFISRRSSERVRSFAAARMDMSDTVDEYEDIYRSLDSR